MNMQDATWGMYLGVRYFPYPKICFSYLKIRQAVHFESLRFHAHFVLLCSSRASLEPRFCRDRSEIIKLGGPYVPPKRQGDRKRHTYISLYTTHKLITEPKVY